MFTNKDFKKISSLYYKLEMEEISEEYLGYSKRLHKAWLEDAHLKNRLEETMVDWLFLDLHISYGFLTPEILKSG